MPTGIVCTCTCIRIWCIPYSLFNVSSFVQSHLCLFSFSPSLISQGHITVYSYNGEVLYQLSETGGGVALSGGGSERLTPFLMTALSGMCFASNPTDSGSTLLIVMSYEAQITTYCLK